jgi:uncharacterized SAM-binding protein YcdF (DUF218 family)
MVEMETAQTNTKRLWLRVVMTQTVRLMLFLTLVLSAGFVAFAYSVISLPHPKRAEADGIVVLTGGEERITEAVKLLSDGYAKRLLISGVNPSTTKPELISSNGIDRNDARLFRCCIDLDRKAINTEDNAIETTVWAREQGFRSLIVVTSNYHMPRSLIEIRQNMPEADLIPYPVKVKSWEREGLSRPECFRLLAKEYVKFLTATVRYAAKSLRDDSAPSQDAPRTVNARIF